MKKTKTYAASLVALLALLSGVAVANAAPDQGASHRGNEFTVGFSTGTAANPYLKAISDATQAVVERAGGNFELRDAQLDPNKQIADIDQLVAEGVDAIAFVAFDERLVGPALERAKDAGILLFGVVYELNYDGDPPSPPVDGQVLDDRPQVAQDQADYLNEVLSGQGEVVYIDFGLPVSALRFSREAFTDDLAQYSGMDLVGVFENPTDDIAGGRTQADAALTEHQNLNAIVAYNDTTALGAVRAVEAAGKEGDVIIVGSQLQPNGVRAIRNGTLSAAADNQPVLVGKRTGKLIVAAIRGKPESQWQKTVVVPAVFYDESNIDDWVPWTEQLAAIRDGK